MALAMPRQGATTPVLQGNDDDFLSAMKPASLKVERLLKYEALQRAAVRREKRAAQALQAAAAEQQRRDAALTAYAEAQVCACMLRLAQHTVRSLILEASAATRSALTVQVHIQRSNLDVAEGSHLQSLLVCCQCPSSQVAETKRLRPIALARIKELVALRNEVEAKAVQHAAAASADRLEAVLQLKADIEVIYI